jgi:thiosulfate/3-mercaptopyruvate sulfurtransferase
MIEAHIKSGIISAQALSALLNSGQRSNIVVLDATFPPPNSDQDPYEDFKKRHIKGAQFFDIEAFSDHGSYLPHMLCGPEEFSAKAGALGIDRDDLVVVYGQNGMIMGAARCWWTFKAFGHKPVVVLDGGLPAWLAEGFSTEIGVAELPPFKSYAGAEGPKMLSGLEEEKASEGNGLVLDARAEDRYAGIALEPREGLRSGHIPWSRNTPCSALVDPKSGKFKSESEIRAFFEAKGLKSAKSAILTCGSGVTACALALGLHHIGFGNWSVYDGSWAEWGQERLDLPVEQSKNT